MTLTTEKADELLNAVKSVQNDASPNHIQFKVDKLSQEIVETLMEIYKGKIWTAHRIDSDEEILLEIRIGDTDDD